MNALARFRAKHGRLPKGPTGYIGQTQAAYHRRAAIGILSGALRSQHDDVRRSYSFRDHFPERFPRGMAGYWSFEAAKEQRLAKLAGWRLP